MTNSDITALERIIRNNKESTEILLKVIIELLQEIKDEDKIIDGGLWK